VAPGAHPGLIPKELGQLTALTALHLANNEFAGEIPKELGNLVNLWHLTLVGNPLQGRNYRRAWSSLCQEYDLLFCNSTIGTVKKGMFGGKEAALVKKLKNCKIDLP